MVPHLLSLGVRGSGHKHSATMPVQRPPVVKGTGPGSFTHAFREGLVRCRAQAQAYGACVRAALPAVEKGACEREFAALRACFFAAVRCTSLARACEAAR